MFEDTAFVLTIGQVTHINVTVTSIYGDASTYTIAATRSPLLTPKGNQAHTRLELEGLFLRCPDGFHDTTPAGKAYRTMHSQCDADETVDVQV